MRSRAVRRRREAPTARIRPIPCHRAPASATDGVPTHRHTSERRTTETKASFKTTEFFAYLAVLAGILIAGLLVDGDGSGADGGFSPSEVWQLATFLTIGYMVSRGLAKSGSRDPYTHDRDDH
ncbi:MAG TPA: hypothetical protein VF533_20970 [Solirubrobacteraceae bacterium]|jgi:hypothetical protein